MDFINQLNLGSRIEIVLITAICYALTQAIMKTNIVITVCHSFQWYYELLLVVRWFEPKEVLIICL